MKNRSSYAVLTRFGIIAAIVATLVLIAPAATAQSECELDGSTVKCTYVENDEVPVANFSATDEEGDPYTWSLKEDDATDYKKFAISAAGTLTFVSPPDYDSPGDKGGDNVYNVTVVAGAGDRADGERAVEITVTDLNESGTVSFTGNQQPQVDATMTAKLDDEDGQTVRLSWQWSKSESMDGPWENVASTTASYTPNEADVGSYLQATVSYTDVQYDEADEVSGVTTYKVRERPASNAAPKFEAQTIEAFENTAGGIGTVTASDDDVLLYRLWEEDDPAVDSNTDGDADVDSADNDNARFKISDTGDLSLNDKLDFEQPTGGALNSVTDIDENSTGLVDTENIVEYTVVVTAIDPSGARGSGAIVVHLLNVDEAPAVSITAGGSGDGGTGDEPEVVEAGTDPADATNPRTGQITAIGFAVAPDPEEGTIDEDNSEGGWMLEGPDAAKFDFDSTDATQILFKGEASGDDGFFRPNFEDKKDANGDNVYEVTVVVPVAGSVQPGKKTVKVKVTDAEDTGELKIAAREPQVGATVSGTLTDEDGGERDRVWQWYRGGASDVAAATLTALTRETGLCADVDEDATTPCIIDRATAPSYQTTSADGGLYVHLVVTYTDAHDSLAGDGTDTATLVARPTRAVQSPPAQNAAPKFGIQDREIDGDDAAPEGVTRNVDENTKAVAEFNAADSDSDLFTFNLGGADGGLFSLSDPSGTDNKVSLSLKDAPDFENPADADGDNSYEVSITAKDPSGATDILTVTVVVGDVDDKPVVSFAGDEMCDKGGTVECTYAENGEDPVATFSVADDENDPTTWALKEADDYKKFAISADGVLTFASSPNFDSAGDADEDNVYKVTVVADAGDRADGEKAVEVTVTDKDESGTVNFLGNQQPQVGELMTAKLNDEDGRTVRLSWQWSKSESMDGPWEDVSSTNASYRATADDVGSYLRATVSYTDVEFDAADEVSGVTTFKVRARPSANAAPTIPAQSIEVFENVDGSIGTVTAKDDDVLIFAMATGTELELTTASTPDANDNARFTITDSGELKLADKLNFEQPTGDNLNSNTNVAPAAGATDEVIEYTAIVKATDPSGASGVGKVIVELLNVDEAPTITSSLADSDNATTVSEVGVQEDGAAITGQITAITFTAGPDPEADAVNTTNIATGGPDSSDTLRWTLEGPDASRFALDGTSLTFKGAEADDDKFRPNYEKPADADKDNVYEVTVVVPVFGSNVPGKRSVKVTVEKAEDTGSLTIEARQPQVGATVSGKLTDEDGGIRDRVWQWYRGDDDAIATDLTALGIDDDLCGDVEESDTVPCIIDKAESSSYVTTSADGGFVIHLVVTYTDAHDNTAADGTDTATLKASPTRAVQAAPDTNEAPNFGIQDREIDGDDQAPEHVMRMVKEGNKPVADFIGSDGDDELLTFKLGGDDGDKFSLSGPSGTENTVALGFKDAPDFENPADADGDNSYEVSIIATDPSGATDTLMVTVMVEDVDDSPTIELNFEPAFDADTAEREVAENSAAGTDVGAAVEATDPNGDADTLTYSLGGTDAASFDIDGATGQITTVAALDYESEMTSYSVTVTVTDRGGLTATIDVTINVTDVNDAPTFDAGAGERMIEENMEAGSNVGDPVAATDQDGDELTYSISESMYFEIDAATGQIATTAVLDYEAIDSHEVTVTVSDGEATDEVAVTIGVIDVEESVCVLGGATPSDASDGLDSDCVTLLEIRDDLVGEGTELNWSAETPMSEWDGVSSGTGRVVSIFLRTHGLAGVIPGAFNNLDALEKLQLHDNDLTGGIPDLSSLDNLIWLILQKNSLSGSLPATLGDMDSLDYVYLRDNDFSGEIPTELAGVMTLRRVDLRDNDLTGEIPGGFGDIDRLRYLMLSDNGLSGAIPAGLGNAANMNLLYLANNALTGEIPVELGNVTTLRRLQLHNNMLTGDVPAELGNLTELRNLSLSGNMLTGCIPAAVIDAAVDADHAGLMACADDGS